MMSLKQKEFQQRQLAHKYGVQSTKFWNIRMKVLLVIIILLVIIGLVMERSQHSAENKGHEQGNVIVGS